MSATPGRTRVDIVLPVYNEVTVLEASVTTLLTFLDGQPQYEWRLVIADNGSTDGTSDLARALASRDPRVRALVLTIKGRGYALRDAWVGSDADIVSYMDIDLSTDIKHIPRLIDMIAIDGCDVAIGSRLAKGSKTERQIKREITSRGYVLLIRAFFPAFVSATPSVGSKHSASGPSGKSCLASRTGCGSSIPNSSSSLSSAASTSANSPSIGSKTRTPKSTS